MREISAKTKQLGIIGCPVEHSFSPKMHNFISDRLNKDYIYSAWRVEKENLGAAINGVRALGIRGINVTAPHKIEVMQYLDEISEQARYLGSVNTVVNNNGILTGYNTDADGFLKSLHGAKLNGAKILVFGAGGVVKPTLLRIAQEKPSGITILNRTKEKAERLAAEISEAADCAVCAEMNGTDYDIVINTTSAGMEPQTNALPTDSIDGIDNLDFISSSTLAVDMIYNPAETRFLYEARKRGAVTVNGLGMLIYQGVLAYELFTGETIGDDIIKAIEKEVFGR